MDASMTTTVDPELLAQAKELGFDVNSLLAHEIYRRREALRKAQEFYEENREAIDSYNAHVAEHGTVGSRHGLRKG